jgi:hypothetical protein
MQKAVVVLKNGRILERHAFSGDLSAADAYAEKMRDTVAQGTTVEVVDELDARFKEPFVTNADIFAQIEAEERKQPRAVRDFVLKGDKTRVQAIEDKIVALRAQLI